MVVIFSGPEPCSDEPELCFCYNVAKMLVVTSFLAASTWGPHQFLFSWDNSVGPKHSEVTWIFWGRCRKGLRHAQQSKFNPSCYFWLPCPISSSRHKIAPSWSPPAGLCHLFSSASPGFCFCPYYLSWFFFFFFFQFYWDMIDMQHCISLRWQHNDLTYIHHEMIITVRLVNIHHPI